MQKTNTDQQKCYRHNQDLAAKGEETYGKHTIDPQISAEHLAGAVRFATVSNADNSLTDYTKFDAFHEYLKETYPLVHKHLTLEHTDQAGLLYHWKGTGKSGAAPLLLMAHQDVVPEGDLEKWTYPPYSGTIADGKIWGRGSSDCKSNLIGQMEAVEALLEKGYEPDYDLYLSYGYMEEVAGGKIPAGDAQWNRGPLRCCFR